MSAHLSDTDREYQISLCQVRLATADNEDERAEAEAELERLSNEAD